MTNLQLLIQTRADLETSRPHLIDAIRRNQTSDPAIFWRLTALRDHLDAVIDDLYRQQMDQKEAA